VRPSPSSDAADTDPLRRRSRDCGVVLCGGGPAATGVIVCAAQDGRLADLLDHGVCVIEEGESLAAGSIGHYRITGNTPALSFVRWLETPASRDLFDAVAADPATEALLRQGSRYPPLRLVGPYLVRLGVAVQQILESHAECTVALRTSVRSIRLLEGGGVRVTAERTGDGKGVTVTAAHAVVAMGGSEPPGLETLGLLPRLTLSGYESKLCHASALIDDRLGLPPHLVEAVRDTRSAVVVGGSHSAWSAAWVLLHDDVFRSSAGEPPRVTLLHRSPVLFFYPTVQEARAAGYDFDDVLDVCPSSGNVYRYAGLRAPDTRALALAALGSGPRKPPVRAVRLLDEPKVRTDVRRALDGAGLVVAAVGYRAHLPELVFADGRRLEPALSDTGLVVTPDAKLVAADGTVVPEILVSGLGAGLAADSGLACEPSYAGRFDAVRLYQNEVGRIVLGSILPK
jgi:Pyridine nucleotide-disulphide oxidoreductase